MVRTKKVDKHDHQRSTEYVPPSTHPLPPKTATVLHFPGTIISIIDGRKDGFD